MTSFSDDFGGALKSLKYGKNILDGSSPIRYY